eukprot:Tamp_19778.p4 GENE.Tamp_19778~~Tamp_19778.p4  ORF type:complete len:111 (-),score=15.35 Tamp_19778:555-887(-)
MKQLQHPDACARRQCRINQHKACHAQYTACLVWHRGSDLHAQIADCRATGGGDRYSRLIAQNPPTALLHAWRQESRHSRMGEHGEERRGEATGVVGTCFVLRVMVECCMF